MEKQLKNYSYRFYDLEKTALVYGYTHVIIKEKNESGTLYYAIKISNFPETKPMSLWEIIDRYKEELDENMKTRVKDDYNMFWEIDDLLEIIENTNKVIINDMIVEVNNRVDEEKASEYEKYIQNLIEEPYYKEDVENPHYHNCINYSYDSCSHYGIDYLHNQPTNGSIFKNQSFRHIKNDKIIFESSDPDEIFNYLKEYGVERIIPFHDFKINGRWLNMAKEFSFKNKYLYY